MATTFGELDSRVFEGLGGPPSELCPMPDIHAAVVQQHNMLNSFTRTSDTNVVLSVTAEFTPTAYIHDITTLINKGIPAFLEIEQNDRFEPVRVVNLSQLSKYNDSFEIVCAFYGNEAGLQFIQFNFIPQTACRIQYDADTKKKLVADNSSLPDHVSDLIVLLAQNTLIPRMKLRITNNMTRSEQARLDLQPVMQSLSEVYAQNMTEIPALQQLWRIWSFRNREAQTDITRREPRGRHLYGD